ncbi:DUF4158 domain-containing protein [Nonomuraea sp. NPDC003707]
MVSEWFRGVWGTSIDRTAYPRFARAVSARELAEVFTPSAAEVEWTRGKTQDDQHLLALLVWLKACQRLGYSPKLKDVPAVVFEHIREMIGLPEGWRWRNWFAPSASCPATRRWMR